MNDYRTEKDSLRTASASGRTVCSTDTGCRELPYMGLKQYRAFIWAMAMIKRAAAEVNYDLGLFSDKEAGDTIVSGEEIARAIMDAADEVIAGKWDVQFVVDPFQAGAGTSHNMNANEVIANRADSCLASPLMIQTSLCIPMTM